MYIGLDTWLHRRLRARLHEQAQGVYGLAVVLPIACKALYIMYLVRGGGQIPIKRLFYFAQSVMLNQPLTLSCIQNAQIQIMQT